MRFARSLVRIVACGTICALAACAGGPKPTIVQAKLEVQPTVNPDARGRPSPIVVRMYALKSLASFNSADFFSLFDKDTEALGADLLDRDEFQLMPGEKRQFQKQFQPDTQYIGVVAAFRDLEHAQWRAAVAVASQKTSPVQINLDRDKIAISIGK